VARRSKPSWAIQQGDCAAVLRTLPDQRVHCVVTSPPFYGVRDYQTAGQHGSEATMEQWLASQMAVFDEVRRVLRDDGLCWVNLGDKWLAGEAMGQPWRHAFAMKERGWRLVMDCIHAKLNPTPEPLLRKRPTLAHEYMFMFAKHKGYFYDNQNAQEDRDTPVNRRSVWRFAKGGAGAEGHYAAFPEDLPRTAISLSTSDRGCCEVCGAQVQRVMELTELGKQLLGKGKSWHDHSLDAVKGQRTKNCAQPNGAGLRRCVGWRRTCEHKGAGLVSATVLDPYAGRGTTGMVALSLGRSFVGIELDPKSVRLCKKNLAAGSSLSGRVTEQDLQAREEAGQMDGIERLLWGKP
jgi:site-specific DNA-methyltransferase (cytosine-N4-specific)